MHQTLGDRFGDKNRIHLRITYNVQRFTLETYSVLRLPARRASLTAGIPKLKSAPVSVKRVELNRSPRHRGYGR
jgi:hypothetical protein